MFIIFLRFSDNKHKAPQLMPDHNAWIKNGFDDGVFVMAGTLQPKAGGAILAHGTTLDDLKCRVLKDPFVEADVVRAEIHEITPARMDDRLGFLKP